MASSDRFPGRLILESWRVRKLRSDHREATKNGLTVVFDTDSKFLIDWESQQDNLEKTTKDAGGSQDDGSRSPRTKIKWNRLTHRSRVRDLQNNSAATVAQV
jgi:hypothetical protein